MVIVSFIDLYEIIFKRKSIRKYDQSPLSDDVLSEIETFAKNTESLLKDIETEIQIISKDSLSFLLPVKAPHYLLMSSENKEGFLTNAGFILQQIDLFLSSKGIGSCYLGMAQPTRATKKNSNLEFVMVIAFGNPAEAVHRSNPSEFKRRSFEDITDIKDNGKLLEAARLAPSATNSQPWYFTGEKDVIHAYCIKSNLLKALVYDKMNKIDMGISLCHIAVAAEHNGGKVEFLHDTTASNNPPKGYYYIGTLSIK